MVFGELFVRAYLEALVATFVFLERAGGRDGFEPSRFQVGPYLLHFLHLILRFFFSARSSFSSLSALSLLLLLPDVKPSPMVLPASGQLLLSAPRELLLLPAVKLCIRLLCLCLL